MTKPTDAMLRFLREHNAQGYRPRFGQHNLSTYDFVGRVRDEGYVTIIKGMTSGWPYSWESTQLTTAGREALKGREKPYPTPMSPPTLPAWIDDFLNRRNDVERTLRGWARKGYVPTPVELTEIANKLSVPAEFGHRDSDPVVTTPVTDARGKIVGQRLED